MDPKTNDCFLEAMGSLVFGEINKRIVRELRENISILHLPPLVILSNHKDNLSVVTFRCYKQRYKPVVELMVEVASISSGGEYHGWHFMDHLAAMLIARMLHKFQLTDAIHYTSFPLSCVWFDYFLWDMIIIGGVEEDGGRRRVCSDVAFH